jgi:hypothetical protein
MNATTETPATWAAEYPTEAAQIDQLLADLGTLATMEFLAQRVRHYAEQPGNSFAMADAEIMARAAFQIEAEAN